MCPSSRLCGIVQMAPGNRARIACELIDVNLRMPRGAGDDSRSSRAALGSARQTGVAARTRSAEAEATRIQRVQNSTCSSAPGELVSSADAKLVHSYLARARLFGGR